MPPSQPVFDYTSSAPWEQVVRAYGSSEELNRAVRELVAEGNTKAEAWEAIWDHEVRRFERDPEFRSAVRRIY